MPPSPPRDREVGKLEEAQRTFELTGKRKMIKPKGSKERVDEVEWLKLEVRRGFEAWSLLRSVVSCCR